MPVTKPQTSRTNRSGKTATSISVLARSFLRRTRSRATNPETTSPDDAPNEDAGLSEEISIFRIIVLSSFQFRGEVIIVIKTFADVPYSPYRQRADCR